MGGIALVGHLCVDISPQLGAATPTLRPGQLEEIGPVTLKAGGSVANTGRALASLGVPIRAHGAVGDDRLGEVALSLLASEGFSTAGIRVFEGGATSYSIILQLSGLDRVIWHHQGVNESFTGAHSDFSGMDVVHIGYPPLLPGMLHDKAAGLQALLERARDLDVSTSVDMAVVDSEAQAGKLDWASLFDELMPRVDIFSPSIDDICSALRVDEPVTPELIEQFAQRFISQGAAIVAISAGARGIHLRTGSRARLDSSGRATRALDPNWADRSIWQHAFPVGDQRTTNGAGDTATAGLLAGIFAGYSADDSVALAAAAAARHIAGESLSLASAHALITATTSGALL